MQTTTTKQEQAETLIVRMDACQQELENASEYDFFQSCKQQLEELAKDVEALGYRAVRCPTGWKLEEGEGEPPVLTIVEDSMGLYAAVPSAKGKTSYRVGICARWLKATGCNCTKGQYGQDCPHQVRVDAQLRDIRPTFSDWIDGRGARQETIDQLLLGGTLRQAA